MKITSTFTAVAVAAALTVAVGACGGSAASAPTSHSGSPAATTRAAAPPPSAAPAVPTLRPGKTVTFTVAEVESGEAATSVTWTMGKKVVQTRTNPYSTPAPRGYEYLAFKLTIKDNGPAVSDPIYQSFMQWISPGGRVDDTLASTGVGASGFGLHGQDIGLVNALHPGQSASGVLALQVPNKSGVIQIVDGTGSHIYLQIDY